MVENAQTNGGVEVSGQDALRIAAQLASETARKSGGLPPVHLWHPPHCGEIGLKIARDGTWIHQNSPITRPALVKLFSTILRRDPDRYVLVTPVEMIAIAVEDAPFIAVELIIEDKPSGRELNFRTNVDDWVRADSAHPLSFEPGESGGLKPYIEVRAGLRALVKRALFYDLAELGETRDIGGQLMYGVASAGEFFVMAPAADIEGLA